MHRLRFRQVHLDYHTNGLIPGVGAKFSKKNFQEALKVGHVDSVTLFAKCHHGWSYHATKVGWRHPELRTDLLARQIDACREIGVRCPIYLSAGVDELMAMEHPDWVVKQRNGVSYDPLQAGWFKLLRFNSSYLDYLCAQIEEVVQTWPDNDGIFLDIVAARPDFSETSLREMKALRLKPEEPAHVAAYAQRVLLNYYKRANAAVRSAREDTPVFHNGGHVPVGARKFNGFNSHFELESLPTGGWGYDHFALAARYAATQPRDFLGMTGKFHTTWGEFGGFKRPAALRYECAAMLASGAKCSIGDQLHPDGAMNADTYRLIGAAYAEVAKKEPWCDEVRPVARIALVSAERNQAAARWTDTISQADEGAGRMLLEAHLPFVVLDEEAAWTGYDLVVLPESAGLTPRALKRAKAFLKNGGKILAAGGALLNEAQTAFALNPGARLVGRAALAPDYLLATAMTPAVPVRSPIVIAGGAWDVELTGARVLVERRAPYFNRTWEHFCSHQHAPDAPGAVSPAVIVNPKGNVAWFAHDIFSQYRQQGQPLYRDFVVETIWQLLGGLLPAETSLPTDGRFNLLEQRRQRRYIAHLLYAPKSLRGGAVTTSHGLAPGVEIIEELLPLRDTRVSLRVPRTIKTARIVPEGEMLPFVQTGDAVAFTVREFTGHQMVELAY
jgi:hypothetical protein